jgi:hypothetical protein
MSVHVGRATLVGVALAEAGAVVGALFCWVFLAVWMLLAAGLPSVDALRGAGHLLLGTALWAGLVGAPAGAVLLPLLGFTLLRRVPVGRAFGYALLGALIGLLAAAVAVPRGPMWPVPILVPVLGVTGLLAGAVIAWRRTHTARRTTAASTAG